MQVVVRVRNAQFIEKDLRHVFVVVLSRVDNDFRDLACKTVFNGAA